MNCARARLLAVVLALPLLAGCAVGLGQLGPAGNLGAPPHALGIMAGVGYQAINEKFSGQRDSTWMRQFQGSAELAWNLPGNLLSVGGAATYIDTGDMNRSTGALAGPSRMRFKGYGLGPSAFLRLDSKSNVEVKRLRLTTRMESTDGGYAPAAGITRVDVPGTRWEYDLNVRSLTSRGVMGLKAGWQVTKTEGTDMFGAKRHYTSSGPHLFVWHSLN